MPSHLPHVRQARFTMRQACGPMLATSPSPSTASRNRFRQALRCFGVSVLAATRAATANRGGVLHTIIPASSLGSALCDCQSITAQLEGTGVFSVNAPNCHMFRAHNGFSFPSHDLLRFLASWGSPTARSPSQRIGEGGSVRSSPQGPRLFRVPPSGARQAQLRSEITSGSSLQATPRDLFQFLNPVLHLRGSSLSIHRGSL